MLTDFQKYRFRLYRLRALAVFSLLFFFYGCFDYEEKIVFNNDFSGVISFHYTVPLYPDENRTMLQYFPIEKADIEEKWQKSISEYSINYLETNSINKYLRKTATVSYKIEFLNPAELERLMIGENHIKMEKKTLIIERQFPHGSPVGKDADRISRQIHGIINQSLNERFINFSFEVPPIYYLKSNLGSNEAPHILKISIPLKKMLMDTEDVKWKVQVTTNPFSQAQN